MGAKPCAVKWPQKWRLRRRQHHRRAGASRHGPGPAAAGEQFLQCAPRRLIGNAIDAFRPKMALEGSDDFKGHGIDIRR